MVGAIFVFIQGVNMFRRKRKSTVCICHPDTFISKNILKFLKKNRYKIERSKNAPLQQLYFLDYKYIYPPFKFTGFDELAPPPTDEMIAYGTIIKKPTIGKFTDITES